MTGIIDELGATRGKDRRKPGSPSIARPGRWRQGHDRRHVDLAGVAHDVLLASITELKPARKSWSGWFLTKADARRRCPRNERELEKLAERLKDASNDAEAAIMRLKSREIG
ncbi:hypothetical protein KRR38_10120 [Novosphingobium sp. G106]|uniref:hypothetical protein n=1 Tax=Novosphingobium sp. G106 TaxID=2849500 RepID=UPI001C2D301C|nr:hypothetical protein [Novosphingobium sp. G106]MBV1688020.1 hypothetical protein [Novosphingobium sp. G106]